MSDSKYTFIDSSGNLQISDLQNAVVAMVGTTGLPNVKIGAGGKLMLTDALGNTLGQIKYDSGLQYSNDGGTTWAPINATPYAWNGTVHYASGTLVEYDGAWWICTIDNTHGEHPSVNSSNWRLLTLGSVYRFAHSASQLQSYLDEGAADVVILARNMNMGASLGFDMIYNVVSNISTLYTTAGCKATAKQIFQIAAGKNLYWHAQGTGIYGADLAGGTLVIEVQGDGHLWIERLEIKTGSLQFVGNVHYQQVTGGTVTGGTQEWWTMPEPGTDKCVPLNLGSLPLGTYDDSLKLYVQGTGSNYKYLTAGTMLEQMASKAAKYFHINATGATLPTWSAAYPVGYVYYVTTTGDVYVSDGTTGWGPAVHIQGPAGSDGTTPVISCTQVPEGYEINITIGGQSQVVTVNNGVSPTLSYVQDSSTNAVTVSLYDVNHPSVPQQFTLPAGVTPAFTSVTATTLAPGSQATASITGTVDQLALSLGIPAGRDGDGSQALTFNWPLTNDNNTVSLAGFPSTEMSEELSILTVSPGGAYAVESTPTTLTLTIENTNGVFGYAWVLVTFGNSAAVTLDAGSGGSITVVDTLQANKVNLLRLMFIGTSVRVYVEDSWNPPENN